MRYKRLAALALASGLVLGGAGVAYATVSATPNPNNIGMGGYDVNKANITENQGVFAGDQYGLTIKDGRQGIQMCNGTSGESAKLGLLSSNLNTVYSVQWAVAAANGCPANGPLTGTTIPALSQVPFGHHVWLNEQLVTKRKIVKVLICILVDKEHGRPVPTPSPSVTHPIATPSTSESSSAAPAPTESVSTSPSATPTDTSSPTVNPLGTPTPEPTKTKQDIGTGPDIPITRDDGLPGFTLHCFVRVHVLVKSTVVFEAQDLDAPVATPLAGDLAGVQTVAVHVPNGTTFDHASWGINENTTNLVGCTGAGFPTAVGGPAAYDSAACQPVTVGEFTTYQVGGGPAQNLATTADTVTELISRNPPTAANANATVAPNNSLANLNLGPHGTASDASTVGGHFVVFTANAPTS